LRGLVALLAGIFLLIAGAESLLAGLPKAAEPMPSVAKGSDQHALDTQAPGLGHACPLCPDSHSSNDSHTCCGHHFDASSSREDCLLGNHLFFSLLSGDQFRLPPQVYLDRFIPPQNLA